MSLALLRDLTWQECFRIRDGQHISSIRKGVLSVRAHSEVALDCDDDVVCSSRLRATDEDGNENAEAAAFR